MQGELFVEGLQERLWTSVSGNLASRRRPPLVFVHADLGTLHQWDEIRAGLEGAYATVAIDRRGHGRSEAPRDAGFSFGSAAATYKPLSML